MPKLSTVTIAEPKYALGQFIIIRVDLPDIDREHVWCGRSLGWLPKNKTTRIYHRLYGSVETATRDAERYITWPLPE